MRVYHVSGAAIHCEHLQGSTKGLIRDYHHSLLKKHMDEAHHVLDEAHKVLDVSKDEYGNRFELHAHNVGHPSEWHGIHKTHQHGEKLTGAMARGGGTVGKPKYVAGVWKKMKADHKNPNISYVGVKKMGQVKEETVAEAHETAPEFMHTDRNFKRQTRLSEKMKQKLKK